MGGFTENHRAHLEKLNEKNAQIREERIKKLAEFFINREGGASVKEIAVELGYPAPSVRTYLKELVADGRVVVLGREWRTVIYGWHNGPAKPVSKETVEEAFPDHEGGKEFDHVKPAVNVNQGDIVWASSRSGDGMFFRYLVLVPWEKKATVVGVLPEGHKYLNINDQRFVPLGEFNNENLYADLTNICSRAYMQFGEEEGKISENTLTEVKRRVARLYRIQTLNGDAIASATKQVQSEYKKLEAAKNRFENENKELKDRVKSLAMECDEKKKDWDDMHKLAKEALTEIDTVKADRDAKISGMRQIVDAMGEDLKGKRDQIADLETKNKDLGIQLDQYGKDLVDLEAENNKLREQLAEPVISADTDALLWKISLLETELSCKDEMIAFLKEVILNGKA